MSMDRCLRSSFKVSQTGNMFWKTVMLIYICVRINCEIHSYDSNTIYQSYNEKVLSSRVLSRTKRLLIFPDGSSLQLVFCCQTAAAIPIGDIFLYGNTVGLAWSLPTDSKFLLMLKKYEKTTQRRGDEKNIYYVDGNGKFLARVPYKRRPIVNPAFAKWSVDEPKAFKNDKTDRVKMHEMQSKRYLLDEELLGDDIIQFHRNNRMELYEKIASIVTVLGGDGRQCVLHKLCETARISRQGTFLQELIRVVFTLPKGTAFEEEDHKFYDKAHSPYNDCDALYPGCSVKF